jgi:hypothetical protein
MLITVVNVETKDLKKDFELYNKGYQVWNCKVWNYKFLKGKIWFLNKIRFKIMFRYLVQK